MKKITLLTVFMSLCLLPLRAQQGWTLRQCIEYAVENNISIKQQELQVEDTETDLNTLRNSRLPDLSAGVSQGFSFGRTPSLNTNIYENSQSSYTSLSVNSGVQLYAGGRTRNRIRSTELNLQAVTEGLEKARQDLEITITRYYLDVLYNRELVGIHSKQVALDETLKQRTAILVENGKLPRSNLYEIEAQLADNRANLTSARNTLGLSLLKLRQALNLPTDIPFDIATPDMGNFVFESRLPVGPERTYEQALAVKPHIRQAEYSLEASIANLRVAKADYLPSVNLSLSYGNGFSHVFGSDFNESFSKQIRTRGSEGIGLNMSIPIFNRNQSRNAVRSARINIRRQELELENVKLSVRHEIEEAYYSAVAARDKYIATEKAVDASGEALKYVNERYDVGKATVYEISEASQKLVSSESQMLRAKYEYIFTDKILDFYRGEPITLDY